MLYISLILVFLLCFYFYVVVNENLIFEYELDDANY